MTTGRFKDALLSQSLFVILVTLMGVAGVFAQSPISHGSKELVQVDKQGVIRWKADNREVALYGANYSIMSGHDYAAVGQYTSDRKGVVDQDMVHLARMGWDGVRLALWGDWENCDKDGNLIVNDRLDLMDYVIAKGRERGIYFLLTPIQTYRPMVPREQSDALTGFSRFYPKAALGTNTEAIAAQCNFLKQLLNHVNPYTKTALKDEPSILFIELVNEPLHHPEDFKGSVDYINALVDAVRSTGCQKIVFHNFTQDLKMASALKASKIQGITAAWYPTSLGFGRNMPGNYLRTVDDYAPLRNETVAKMPRIVYEFDTASLVEPYMYPAMVRAWREVGVQFIAMFMYDYLIEAPDNGGWATHNLNMIYTPAKAVSTIVAAEATRRLPRWRDYGPYPDNTKFGPFRVSYEENLSEMASNDQFLYANDTKTAPPRPSALRRIVGHGSSPVVSYEGEGIYFLDKIANGTWRLELYPDVVMVSDPFVRPAPHQLKWRMINRSWPMTVHLPDLGGRFNVLPVNRGNHHSAQATSGRFTVQPGVYVLTKRDSLVCSQLPVKIGQVSFNEFVCPSPPDLPPQILAEVPNEYLAGQPGQIAARILSPLTPSLVTLITRRTGTTESVSYPMQPAGGYLYAAPLPPDRLAAGVLEYAIEATAGGTTVRYPDGGTFAQVNVVEPASPLTLFGPSTDRARWAFTRVSDSVRQPQMSIGPSASDGQQAMRLFLPLSFDKDFKDYTVSVIINDRIAARKATLGSASAIKFQARASADHKEGWITLVEADGTGWTKQLSLTTEWQEVSIPLNQLAISRSVKLPHGYPEMWWLYWCDPAKGRGGTRDHLQLDRVERIQLSHRQAGSSEATKDNPWIEIGPVQLVF